MTEVLKLALEAMKYHTAQTRPIHQTNEAIAIVEAALAQLAQEPVAWLTKNKFSGKVDLDAKNAKETTGWSAAFPVYTTPQQRPWVDLAPEDRLCAKYMLDAPEGIEAVIDYITTKLKEKNI